VPDRTQLEVYFCINMLGEISAYEARFALLPLKAIVLQAVPKYCAPQYVPLVGSSGGTQRSLPFDIGIDVVGIEDRSVEKAVGSEREAGTGRPHRRRVHECALYL
jgi:hypothetical protein